MVRCGYAGAVAVIAVIVPFAAVLAGPLDPPAGPVAATGKTLSQLEPRTAINAANTPGDGTCTYLITAPGSYYLTGNLTGEPGKDGIRVVSSDVTIDLSGFSLIGPGTNSGLLSVGGVSGIIVRNGTVSNWLNGVECFSSTASLIENIAAHHNANIGIRGGSSGVIRSCTALDNSGFGIVGTLGSVIESCTALYNGSGIGMTTAGSVRKCVASFNTANGFNNGAQGIVTECIATSNGANGFNLAIGGHVESCSASGNTGNGIFAAGLSTIRNNRCSANSGAGIQVLATCRVEGNTCSGNARGIEAGNNLNIIVRNVCGSNGVNWNVAAGNSLSSIVRTFVNATRIIGDTYPGSIGTDDANANLTY